MPTIKTNGAGRGRPRVNPARCMAVENKKRCPNKGHSRGVCGKHYQRARMAVSRGETTWNKLVAAHKVLPHYDGHGLDWELE